MGQQSRRSSTRQASQPVISLSSAPTSVVLKMPAQRVCHSGGSPGADAAWKEACLAHGVRQLAGMTRAVPAQISAARALH